MSALCHNGHRHSVRDISSAKIHIASHNDAYCTNIILRWKQKMARKDPNTFCFTQCILCGWTGGWVFQLILIKIRFWQNSTLFSC